MAKFQALLVVHAQVDASTLAELREIEASFPPEMGGRRRSAAIRRAIKIAVAHIREGEAPAVAAAGGRR